MISGLTTWVRRFIDSFLGLTRGLKVIIFSDVIGAITAVGFFSVYAKSLGATDMEIGLFSSVRSFIEMLTQLPGGIAGQKWDMKKLYVLSILLSFVSSLLIFLAQDWVWLLASVTISGLTSFVMPTFYALLGIVTLEATRTAALATHGTVTGIVYMVNQPIMGYLADNIGLRPLYLISALGSVVSCVIIYKFLPATAVLKGKVEEKRVSYREALRSVLNWRNFYLMIFQGSMWNLLAVGFYQFISIYFVYDLGWTFTFLGFFGMVGSVLATVTRVPLGKLTEKVGKRAILFMGSLAISAQFALYILVTDPWQLLLIATLARALSSAQKSANDAFWYEIAPIEVFPIIFSINIVVMRAMRFVGSLICAYVWSSTSPQTSFAMLALVYSVIAFGYMALKEKRTGR